MKFEVMKGLGYARDTIFTLELKYWGVIFKVGGKKLYFFKFLTPLSSCSYAEKRCGFEKLPEKSYGILE